jgi:hypothetical protein
VHRIGKTGGLWISQVTQKASGDEGYVMYSDVGRDRGLQLDPQSMQTTAKLSVPEVVALLISVSAMRAAGNFHHCRIFQIWGKWRPTCFLL